MNSTVIKQIYNTVNQPSVFKYEYVSSFGYGKIGLDFFNFIYRKYIENSTDEESFKFVDYIEEMIQNHPQMSPAMNYGLAGLCELMNIANIEKDVFDEDDYLEDIYVALADASIAYIKDNNFDFYAGSIGMLSVFERAFHRIPNTIKPLLEKIVNSFELEKITTLSFKSETDISEDEAGNVITIDNPHYNNGIAHGLPAIILVLSKIQKILPNDYIKNLIYQTIDLIKEYKNPSINKEEQMYLERINFKKDNDYPRRLAWCYSDLTLGWAFYMAGRNLHDEALLQEGKLILDHTIILEETNQLCLHSSLICLCHGSAGNAYIYKRIFDETGDEIFNIAYKKWANKAHENYEKGEIHFEYKLNKYIEDHTIMDGLLGYGLFLIAQQYPDSESWNAFMLLD